MRGWLATAVLVVTVALLACGAWLIVDALRRPRATFGGFGSVPWVGLQAIFVAACLFGLAASLLGFSKSLPLEFIGALGALIVLAAAQQVAYLLRVVFPSPARRARLAEAADAAEATSPAPQGAQPGFVPDSLDPEE